MTNNITTANTAMRTLLKFIFVLRASTVILRKTYSHFTGFLSITQEMTGFLDNEPPASLLFAGKQAQPVILSWDLFAGKQA